MSTDQVFAALADPTRRAVMRFISERGAVTATQLASLLPVSRQAVSKHLGALSEAGLVSCERSGREVHYRLTAEPLADAMSWMVEIGARWDDRLARLHRHLA